MGCASYRDGAFPAPGKYVGDETPIDVVVEGDSVHLQLYSGETYSGEVIWLTNEKLSIGGLGNYGLTDLTIQLTEIKRVELRNQSSGQIETIWFVGIGLTLIGAFIWGLSTMNNSF